jgi:HSP20 family protein
MAEVAVGKTAAPPVVPDLFEPMFPFGRFFGLSPFAMMREFAGEVDKVFRGANGKELEAWTPAIDVQRCNGSLVVKASLPGVKKEDVKVEIADDTLVITGERKNEHKEDHNGYHRWELKYGNFYRAIPLPEGVKTADVKAELKDGILKVVIPAPEVAKKTLEVPVAG